MNLKVYKSTKKEDTNGNDARNTVHQKKYASPTLLRKDGIYYIGYEDEVIQIEEWEAAAVYENPEMVYDLIVSYRRKFYFNTAEDSPDSLYHFE